MANYKKDKKEIYSLGGSQEIDIKLSENAHSKVLKALFNDTYKDKWRFVIEAISNGYDACIEANKPVWVNVITKIKSSNENKDDSHLNYDWLESEDSEDSSNLVIIQDKGIGMSIEDIKNVYSKVMKSGSEGKKNKVGYYGIGSKAPFKMTDIFYISTVKDGKKLSVSLSIREEGYSIKILNSEDTNEESGTSVIVPIPEEELLGSYYDKSIYVEVEKRLKEVAPIEGIYFNNKKINPHIEKDIKGDYYYYFPTTNDYDYLRGRGLTNTSNITFAVGTVIYNIKIDDINDYNKRKIFLEKLKQLAKFNKPFIISVPIDSVVPTLSREEIKEIRDVDLVLKRIDEVIAREYEKYKTDTDLEKLIFYTNMGIIRSFKNKKLEDFIRKYDSMPNNNSNKLYKFLNFISKNLISYTESSTLRYVNYEKVSGYEDIGYYELEYTKSFTALTHFLSYLCKIEGVLKPDFFLVKERAHLRTHRMRKRLLDKSKNGFCFVFCLEEMFDLEEELYIDFLNHLIGDLEIIELPSVRRDYTSKKKTVKNGELTYALLYSSISSNDEKEIFYDGSYITRYGDTIKKVKDYFNSSNKELYYITASDLKKYRKEGLKKSLIFAFILGNNEIIRVSKSTAKELENEVNAVDFNTVCSPEFVISKTYKSILTPLFNSYFKQISKAGISHDGFVKEFKESFNYENFFLSCDNDLSFLKNKCHGETYFLPRILEDIYVDIFKELGYETLVEGLISLDYKESKDLKDLIKSTYNKRAFCSVFCLKQIGIDINSSDLIKKVKNSFYLTKNLPPFIFEHEVEKFTKDVPHIYMKYKNFITSIK